MHDKWLLGVADMFHERGTDGSAWGNMVLTSPWDWCRFKQTKYVLSFGVDSSLIHNPAVERSSGVPALFFPNPGCKLSDDSTRAKWPIRVHIRRRLSQCADPQLFQAFTAHFLFLFLMVFSTVPVRVCQLLVQSVAPLMYAPIPWRAFNKMACVPGRIRSQS